MRIILLTFAENYGALKVLLTTLNAKYIHLNLAIRLLYDLNRDYAGLAWKEFTIKEDKDAIADFCRDFDVVAFSCYIWNISQTLDVARRIRTLNPEVKILLGGPEVSYDWQDVIVRDEVDYIITGEGETPFRAFLESYPDVAHVPGLVRKTDAGIQYAPEAGIFDLTQYHNSRPYQYDDPAELNNKVLYVETSRGCPYKCEFCLASLDNKVRYLPMESIEANLLYLMQNGRTIKFLDRTFNMKRDFTLHVFEFILQNHRPENVFQFEITADILHPDIIRYIDERVPPGLFRFEIGIQTVNQKANLAVSRKQNFDKTKAIIESVRHKVELHLDLIVGLPLDLWEDIRYSFEEVFKLFAPELQMGFLKMLKGTPVRHKYAEHGFVFDPEPPYQIIESNYLSKEQLHQLEQLENALEIYWNKNRARRTLRYVTAQYGSFDFLLALGQYFGTRFDFHKYALNDVFSALKDFAAEHYGDDAVLRELIGLDYCFYHKVRPKPLTGAEIDLAEKRRLLADLNANTGKYRYLALPLSFDLTVFEQSGVVEFRPTQTIIRYDGVNKPMPVGV